MHLGIKTKMKVKIRNCENTVFNLNSLFTSHKNIKQKETESYFSHNIKGLTSTGKYPICPFTLYLSFMLSFFVLKEKDILC